MSRPLPSAEIVANDVPPEAEAAAEALQLVALLSEQVITLEDAMRSSSGQNLASLPSGSSPAAALRRALETADQRSQTNELRELVLRASVAILRDVNIHAVPLQVKNAMQQLEPDDPACTLLRRVCEQRKMTL